MVGGGRRGERWEGGRGWRGWWGWGGGGGGGGAGAAGEGVGDNVGIALAVDHFEVEVGKDVEPVGLALGEAGLGLEVFDGPVVGDDGEGAAMEVVAPYLEALDDGEALPFMVEVVVLGGGEGGGVVGDDPEGGAGALGEEPAGGELGGVGMDGEGGGEIGGGEDGGGDEGELEVFEGGEGGGGPGGGPLVGALEHGVEGGGNGGVVANAAAEEVGEAEEGAELGEGGGEGPLLDGGDLGGVGGGAVFGDDVADKVHLGGGEDALGGVGEELWLSEEGEGGAEVVLVGFGGGGEDQDVVQVDEDEGVEVGAEDVMHEALEGGGGVGEAKGHDGELKVAIAGAEGGLGDVFRGDPNLVVAVAEVNLGEDGGAMEAVKELVNPGEGVAVLDGDGVEGAVVHTKAEGAILLLDEEDGGAERGRCLGGCGHGR